MTMSDFDRENELRKLEGLVTLLDSAITAPGTRLSIGLDGIVGLIPGVGDGATFLAGLWIIWRGAKLGVRKRTLTKMLWNLCLDGLIGAIPILGDLFDIFWKSHRRNIELMKSDLARNK